MNLGPHRPRRLMNLGPPPAQVAGLLHKIAKTEGEMRSAFNSGRAQRDNQVGVCCSSSVNPDDQPTNRPVD